METHCCDYSKKSVSLRQFPEMERGTTEPIITIYANYTIYATSFGPSSRKPIPFTSTSSPSTPSTPRLLSQILLHTKNGLHRHLSPPCHQIYFYIRQRHQMYFNTRQHPPILNAPHSIYVIKST